MPGSRISCVGASGFGDTTLTTEMAASAVVCLSVVLAALRARIPQTTPRPSAPATTAIPSRAR